MFSKAKSFSKSEVSHALVQELIDAHLEICNHDQLSAAQLALDLCSEASILLKAKIKDLNRRPKSVFVLKPQANPQRYDESFISLLRSGNIHKALLPKKYASNTKRCEACDDLNSTGCICQQGRDSKSLDQTTNIPTCKLSDSQTVSSDRSFHVLDGSSSTTNVSLNMVEIIIPGRTEINATVSRRSPSPSHIPGSVVPKDGQHDVWVQIKSTVAAAKEGRKSRSLSPENKQTFLNSTIRNEKWQSIKSSVVAANGQNIEFRSNSLPRSLEKDGLISFHSNTYMRFPPRAFPVEGLDFSSTNSDQLFRPRKNTQRETTGIENTSSVHHLNVAAANSGLRLRPRKLKKHQYLKTPVSKIGLHSGSDDNIDRVIQSSDHESAQSSNSTSVPVLDSIPCGAEISIFESGLHKFDPGAPSQESTFKTSNKLPPRSSPQNSHRANGFGIGPSNVPSERLFSATKPRESVRQFNSNSMNQLNPTSPRTASILNKGISSPTLQNSTRIQRSNFEGDTSRNVPRSHDFNHQLSEFLQPRRLTSNSPQPRRLIQTEAMLVEFYEQDLSGFEDIIGDHTEKAFETDRLSCGSDVLDEDSAAI